MAPSVVGHRRSGHYSLVTAYPGTCGQVEAAMAQRLTRFRRSRHPGATSARSASWRCPRDGPSMARAGPARAHSLSHATLGAPRARNGDLAVTYARAVGGPPAASHAGGDGSAAMRRRQSPAIVPTSVCARLPKGRQERHLARWSGTSLGRRPPTGPFPCPLMPQRASSSWVQTAPVSPLCFSISLRASLPSFVGSRPTVRHGSILASLTSARRVGDGLRSRPRAATGSQVRAGSTTRPRNGYPRSSMIL